MTFVANVATFTSNGTFPLFHVQDGYVERVGNFNADNLSYLSDASGKPVNPPAGKVTATFYVTVSLGTASSTQFEYVYWSDDPGYTTGSLVLTSTPQLLVDVVRPSTVVLPGNASISFALYSSPTGNLAISDQVLSNFKGTLYASGSGTLVFTVYPNI